MRIIVSPMAILRINANGVNINIGGTVGSLEYAYKIRKLVHGMPYYEDVNSQMRVGSF